ncbi:hypothetical protein SLS60_010408 [Paraconiothyrium brasiliense]|uniref:Ankyrin repeat protein n=1 Tax=Paraconiothyrium brasiliense TaxID=300254 RepID=A0ABR3QNF4_9PLEO
MLFLLEAHHGRATSSYYLQDHQDAMYKTLFLASEKGHRDIVRKILDIEGYMNDTQISGTKRTEIMRRACEAGSEMVLQIVLERSFELEGKQSWRPWLDCTLKATAGGHLSITRMLVNTGTIPRPFPLGGAHTSKILGEAAPRHQSAEVIQFLLRRGVINVAQLHEIQINVGFELVHCIIGAAQRGNVGFLEALSHHGIALDDEDFYARADCPVPIIAAKAFRQVDTVRALLALGVADVDPMQSILAHQFANGELPRDPPALLNGAGLNDDNDAVARTAWVIYD